MSEKNSGKKPKAYAMVPPTGKQKKGLLITKLESMQTKLGPKGAISKAPSQGNATSHQKKSQYHGVTKRKWIMSGNKKGMRECDLIKNLISSYEEIQQT